MDNGPVIHRGQRYRVIVTHAVPMPPVAAVPAVLRYKPFRGSAAIAAGLVTARQSAGPAWARLFRDVYISAGVPVDLAVRCQAAALLLPTGVQLHTHKPWRHVANRTFVATFNAVRT